MPVPTDVLRRGAQRVSLQDVLLVVQYIADAGGAYKEKDYPYKGTQRPYCFHQRQ